MKNIFLVFGLAVMTLSCEIFEDRGPRMDVNYRLFDLIQNQPYADLMPDEPVDYWELFNVWDYYEVEQVNGDIIFSDGTKCQNADDQEGCEVEFNGLTTQWGFHMNCLPGGCFHVVRYNRGNNNYVLSSKEEVLSFLGEIDSPSDALLLVFADNYSFGLDRKKEGAIREVDNGYEIIATKLVKFCAPIQRNRYHLLVSKSGTIRVLDKEIISRNENACI